jgi:hypothetical protein
MPARTAMSGRCDIEVAAVRGVQRKTPVAPRLLRSARGVCWDGGPLMRYRCIACNRESPDADTLLVLIRECGWRPLWEHGTIAHPATEWRCPACWEALKEAATHPVASSTKILAQAAIEDTKSDPDGDPKKST